MSNDFLPFAVGGSANVTPQATYAADTAILQGGFQSGLAKSPDLNKVWRQSSIMAAVLAQFIVNTTGQTAIDDGTTATLLTNLVAAVSAQSEALIGAVRNLSMNVTAASATATLTADEIIVGSALGGLKYTLTSFSKTINLATTGAGGMDTGTAPVSGYVALYAIYNPTTSTAALLATNATSAAAPNVYGGANMPSGYTASGLASVWGCNGSSLFVPGYQSDRKIQFSRTTVFTLTSNNSSPTPITAGIIPKNAKRVKGDIFYSSTVTADSLLFSIGPTSGSVGQLFFRAGSSNGQYSFNVELISPQMIYVSNTGATGTVTFNSSLCEYEI
jgi:hypothetical protein